MWEGYAALAVIGSGVLVIVQRLVAVKSQNHLAGVMAFNLVSAALAVGVSLIANRGWHPVWPTVPRAYIFMGIGVLVYGLYERLRFKAASGVEASEFAVIGNVSIMVSFIGSALLYQEGFGLAKIAGTALIIAAITLISWQPETHIFRKAAGWVLLAQFILGVAAATDKMGVMYFRPELYIILLWLLPLTVIWVFRLPLPVLSIDTTFSD